MKSIFYSVTYSTCLVVFLAFGFSGYADPRDSAAQDCTFERMWPKMEQPWYFSWPTDVEVDAEGNVYIADSSNYRIQKFTKDGTFITKWGTCGSGNGEFHDIERIALDNKGYVYVTDSSRNHRVQKFTSDGTFVLSFGGLGHGMEQGKFQYPSGIAVSDNGIVYVGDYHRIQRFTPEGVFLSEWRWDDYGDAFYLARPRGLALDSQGYIYVADADADSIQKFSLDGAFIAELVTKGSDKGQVIDPQDIDVDNKGNIYVTDRNGVQVFSPKGVLINAFRQKGSQEMEFTLPEGIKVDNEGNVLIADKENERIQKISSNGLFISQWGSSGSDNGRFFYPLCLALDNSGNIYVTEEMNHRVQKFTTKGEFVTTWGINGTDQGQFNTPEGIAVDITGNVYVADVYNNRIQKFTSNGDFLHQWGEYCSAEYCYQDYQQGKWEWIYDPDCCLGSFFSPVRIAVDQRGYVYVSDTGNHRIQVFTGDGEFYINWGRKNTGEYVGAVKGREFLLPYGVTADRMNNIYVADNGNYRIQKFTTGGAFLAQWGVLGDGPGEFNSPKGVNIDTAGNVYVADTKNHRILKFSPEGVLLWEFGSQGSAPGNFNTPNDIAVGLTGKIYVADTWNNRIQVFSQESYKTDVSKAIVLAGGGGYSGNVLWDATQMCANYAYRALIYQGFTKDLIFYLTSDTDLDLDSNGKFDDVDSNADKKNLAKAITQWAKDADHVVIYITDHGGYENFRMSENEILNASDLKVWMDELQSENGPSITFIYDACQSGSFLPVLASPHGYQRILISSADHDEQAYFTSTGTLSFSFLFWGHIFNGMSLSDAFYSTQNEIEFTYGMAQIPQMDDNGNGIGNEDEDGFLAEKMTIGNGIVSAEDLPVIKEISPEQNLAGETFSTIFAENVTDTNGIMRVWAVITPPGISVDDPSLPVLDLPLLEMAPAGENRYEGVYSDFTKKGTYRVAVFAKDKNNTLSLPVVTKVIQHGIKNATQAFCDESFNLTIPELHYMESCLKLELSLYTESDEDTDFKWIYMNSALLDECTGCSASMNAEMEIQVYDIECFGNHYEVLLNYFNDSENPFLNYWKPNVSTLKIIEEK